jgi:hypothetical protein
MEERWDKADAPCLLGAFGWHLERERERWRWEHGLAVLNLDKKVACYDFAGSIGQ